MYDYSYAAALLRYTDLSNSGSYPLPPPTPARTCRVFATIREPARGATTTTVCDLRGRIVNVFTSDADRIELRIMTVTHPDTASPRSSGSSGRQPPVANRQDVSDQPDSYIMFRYTGNVLLILRRRGVRTFGRQTFGRQILFEMTIWATRVGRLSDSNWTFGPQGYEYVLGRCFLLASRLERRFSLC